ncbi:MAG: Ig-like domain-containing protein [Clostridia bacterium]|nr:Ig-like domain-containing protein [Clostridia bacterium]
MKHVDRRVIIVFTLLVLTTLIFSFSRIAYAAADDASLSGITIDGVSVAGFSPDVLEYNIDVDWSTTEIDISAAATEPLAEISGDTGNQSLIVGLNSFTITVVSEDTTSQREYVVNITRNEASSDASLFDLSIDNSTIQGFSSSVYTYNLEVSYSVDSIDIGAATSDNNAQITGDTGSQSLVVGLNEFIITCIAEDGATELNYLLNVSRAEASTNSFIDDLKINGETIQNFSGDVFNYEIQLPNDIDVVEFIAITSSSYAQLSGDLGSNELAVGINEYSIICTAEDGVTTSTYTIAVTRTPSSDAILSDISIDSSAISGFSSDVFSYDITVDFTTDHIEIAAQVQDSSMSISGDLGTKILYAGINTFTITCTAEDGTTYNNYILNITRTENAAGRAFSNLGFIPNRAAVDPDRNVVYCTAVDGYSIYRVDLNNGNITYKTFEYKPTHMEVKNGKLYIALRQDYVYGQVTPGRVAVVDTALFATDNIFDVTVNPYDIAVDNQGYVYLSPDTGSYDNKIDCYNSITGTNLNATVAPRFYSELVFHDDYNKLYMCADNGTPRDIEVVEVLNGIITNFYNSPYHGEYPMNDYINISPEGQFLFNGAGTIFLCASDEESDLVFVDQIEGYDSICFDSNNEFYTSNANTLLTYNYNTLEVIEQFDSENDFVDIFYKNDEVLCLQKNNLNQYFFTTNPIESSSNVGAEGIYLNKNDSKMIPGGEENLVATVTPDNATNKNVLWTTSNPAIASVDNGLITAHALGECDITVTTLDGNYTDVCTITVSDLPVIGVYTTSINAFEELGFVPLDSGADPERDVIYLTKKDSKLLYRVDVNTGQVIYMEFIYQAERFDIKNGKIYLTLMHKPHDTMSSGNESGTIVIIDTATFAGESCFNVELDPYDIAVDNSRNAYITSGTGQLSIVESYNSNNGEKISTLNKIYYNIKWDYNEKYNKLYNCLTSYTIKDGAITSENYKSSYALGEHKMSPDGEYMFTGSGGIYTCSDIFEDDVLLDGTINEFTSICFDLDNNAFYTANENVLLSYDYNMRAVQDIFTANDNFVQIFFNNNQLIYLQKKSAGEYYFTLNPEESPNDVLVTGIKLDKELAYVLESETVTLTPEISPINVTNKDIHWSTSNSSVATVTDGVVSGVSEGTCVITATTVDGGYTDTCNITVISQNSQKVAILFGVADYEGDDNDLNGPVNDMTAMKAVLEYAGYTVFKYMDYTSDELLSRVEAIASYLPEDATLLFAYSGHGANGGYIFGKDFVPISVYDLEGKLSLHTGVKEVIIDACYSGGFIDREMTSKSFSIEETEQSFNDYVISAFSGSETGTGMAVKSLAETGYYVLTASSGSQLSYEYAFDITGSLFAEENLTPTVMNSQIYYILGYFNITLHDGFGLYDSTPFLELWADSNGDNFITWNEIYHYTADLINEYQQVQVYPINSDHILYAGNLSSDVYVTSVNIQENAHIDIGRSLQLLPQITPANATNKTVTYTTSDETVATVDSTGLVTAVSLGTATITVTTEDGGYEDTCTVTSGYYVESVDLLPEEVQINIGDNYTFTPVITPTNATNQAVTYSSSDEDIATVDAIGVVWTHSLGTTTITVTTTDGGFTDNCLVKVDRPVESVELQYDKYSMIPGDTLALIATVLPDDARNKNVTFASSNDTIASVDASGFVTANAIGSAIITVTTEDGGYSAQCAINIADELITSSIYTVNREGGFLEDIPIETTVQNIMDAIENSGGEVHIFNETMQEISGDMVVSTGYYVQLIVDESVVDELIILIEGEVHSDGILDIIDYTLIRLHILNVAQLDGIRLLVADINDDSVIDVVDYTLLRLHILNVMPLYN